MKRLALLVVCLAAFAAPAASLAHPLGNFTVNRYAAVELAGDRVYVRYALDLAEIPTFQERARAERPGFAPSLARKLELRLDGRRAPLEVVASRTKLRPGAGGLETLRFDAVYLARGPASRLELRDRNYPSRLGWREIVVRARDGAELRAASVPDKSASNELRAYPDDQLSEPLDVRQATAEFALGDSRAAPPRLAGAPDIERAGNGFESLVDGELTAGVIAVSLLVALFWGAAHALTPGHGKAIVAAYLVGTRGTARHALLLGLVVTVTHTLGVFALGLVTLSLSEFIVPETLYPWMNLVSALLVVGVGVAVLRSRARDLRHRPSHSHSHGHHHHHRHGAPENAGLRGLLAVGISGGLLPCPTALVVLLAAISLHRVGFGLILIVAFSLGLASVISGIGLLAVGARSVFRRLSFEGRLVRALPAVSALVIVCVGIAMTVRALPALA
jgi:nickel/cobalt transporter (NicO) family protein